MEKSKQKQEQNGVIYFDSYMERLANNRRCGLDIDTMTDAELDHMYELKQLAAKQTGLTDNELTLIARCRAHTDLFKLVNVFSLLVLELFEKHGEGSISFSYKLRGNPLD